MIIAGLDIETLSLEPDAVVFEIGIVVYNTSSPNFHSRLIKPRISDQIVAGRRIDQSTIDWHVNTVHGGDRVGFSSRLSEHCYQENSISASPSVAYDIVKADLADVDEIWINGLSFDPVVLSSLFYAYHPGRESIPWNYKKEKDVRTILPSISKPGFPSVSLPACLQTDHLLKHHAVADSTWNVGSAYEYNFGLAELLDCRSS